MFKLLPLWSRHVAHMGDCESNFRGFEIWDACVLFRGVVQIQGFRVNVFSYRSCSCSSVLLLLLLDVVCFLRRDVGVRRIYEAEYQMRPD